MSISIITDTPLALDSYDHIFPFGAARDNHRNPDFIAALRALSGARRLKVLDMGCAGGGFVVDMLEAGHLAVGVDGTDYNLKLGRAGWGSHPAAFFLADICHPFHFVDAEGEPVMFDLITAFDVLEHIEHEAMPAVFDNLHANLSQTGAFLVSLGTQPSPHMGVDLHRTLQPCEAWDEYIHNQGFLRRRDFEATLAGRWLRPSDCYLAFTRLLFR